MPNVRSADPPAAPSAAAAAAATPAASKAAAAAPAALSLDGVRYRWPGAAADTLVVDHFTLAAGERVFLRGPSGCGKSTLLALAAGVLLADAGQVQLLGQNWRTLGAAARDRRRAAHLGVVFQQFNLLPYLSVLDNVRLPLRFSPARARRAAPGAAEHLLERSGLEPALWRQSAGQLSVGQQQRVAAARALIGAPEVVIADEPTSALDEDRREAFMALLLGHCAEAGAALLFVSHDARLAARFDRSVDLPALNRAARPALPAEPAAAA
ncbi:ATP-binding cassette domain-containing protein [Aquabacterium sp. OR-4]|uniref:ATP-binding cassette domain-containing protein n=1 Tax=Aquabacterium sp. OR-4 TaxID=2978127 RepID=UPI0028C8A405|nr:ATP-binding cassette domain-containing protein [Aquabacterium sp. OR-4]MDT7833892.1 ATP-binding cassette domain-containing protein [Aquabacterium sp. OR-4]